MTTRSSPCAFRKASRFRVEDRDLLAVRLRAARRSRPIELLDVLAREDGRPGRDRARAPAAPARARAAAAPCGAARPRSTFANCRSQPAKTRFSSGAKSSSSVSDSAIRASVRSVTIPMRGARPRFMSSTPAMTVDATAPLTPTMATPIRFMTALIRWAASERGVATCFQSSFFFVSSMMRGNLPCTLPRVTCSRKRRAPPLASGTTRAGKQRDLARAVLAVDAVLLAQPRRTPRRRRPRSAGSCARPGTRRRARTVHFAVPSTPTSAAAPKSSVRQGHDGHGMLHGALDLDVRRQLLRHREAAREAPHELDAQGARPTGSGRCPRARTRRGPMPS